MASNNYAESITDPAKAQQVIARMEVLADQGWTFKVLEFDPNSDWFPISCGRVSNLPPLPEIESFGSEIDGANAKLQWNRHVEVVQAITFGNGHAGLMYELGGHAYMLIPFHEADCQDTGSFLGTADQCRGWIVPGLQD